MKPITLILSCEHASNAVPSEYAYLFAQHEDILETHRAIDFGAAYISERLREIFDCDYAKATISRILIDCNRSLSHPKCFSEFSKSLGKLEKQKLIDHYYLPFRQQTESYIKSHIAHGAQVLHLSIHSFTPELNGITRNAAIALLYDPERHAEKEVCRIWRSLLLNQTPSYKIRMNYPYVGSSDGFTSYLRKHYSEKDYLGVEVESNQALLAEKQSLDQVVNALAYSLKELLQLL